MSIRSISTARAILFESGIYAKIPSDLPESW